MFNSKAFCQITLSLLTLAGSVWQQVAAAGEEDKAGQAAADSQQSVTGQPNLLTASNRSVTRHELILDARRLAYTATAASLDIGVEEPGPEGRVFYISYVADRPSDAKRPLTFVFNGGPGAASAYLHMGAMGPRRVAFAADGRALPMPVSLDDNQQSWLAFTDLVFVYPIGTGYSREISKRNEQSRENPSPSSSDSQQKVKASGQTWGVEEDVEVLARFIRAYLTHQDRWLAPLFLAGESYGGFRVARLANFLQSDFSITPSGLVLISPVLDFSLLRGNDRSLWPWVALLPSYTAVADHHGLGQGLVYQPGKPRVALQPVEQFALNKFLTGLAGGHQNGWLEEASQLMGVDRELTQRWQGRVPLSRYAKALLAEQSRLVSLYDGSISIADPYPQLPLLSAGDMYLERINAAVTAAFNSYVRDQLKFRTNLPYLLLNKDVFGSWNWRSGIPAQQGFVEAATGLKRALSVNPDSGVLVTHGLFDLVTPYFASVIAIDQLQLDHKLQDNIHLQVYQGGHMPYLNEQSRTMLFDDAQAFYRSNPEQSLKNITGLDREF